MVFVKKNHNSRPVFGKLGSKRDVWKRDCSVRKKNKDLSWITSHILVITFVDQTAQGEEKQFKQCANQGFIYIGIL